MAVPSSGEISLSRIYKEIHFCEYVGTNNVGGYYSNSSVTGPISLSGLDSDSSVRAAETNKGDSTAPYGMGEWYSYNDWEPNTIYFRVEMSEGVPENPTYRFQFTTSYNGGTTRTAYVYSPGGAVDGTKLLGPDTYVNVRVDRYAPDATVQDGAEITWFSRVDPCDGGTLTTDQVETFANGATVTNRSYYYTNIQEAAYFKVVVIEG
jgi:hypothetical protein